MHPDPADQRYFWLDLEMTGLEPHSDRILEAAAIITDGCLRPLDTYETAVYQPPEVLNAMGEWCREHHTASGLVERVPRGIAESKLDQDLAALAEKHLPGKRVILCGNSIGQDRKFVDIYLPAFASMLHYRMVDVSSFKIIFRDILSVQFEKQNTHRALDDIRESIGELRHYLTVVKLGDGPALPAPPEA